VDKFIVAGIKNGDKVMIKVQQA